MFSVASVRHSDWGVPMWQLPLMHWTSFYRSVHPPFVAYFHQWRRRRIPVRRVSLIITLYYAEHFPLVQRQRWRWRLSLIVTVPILGTDLCPRDRSPSQFYCILIRGLESISVPVEKPAWYSSPCGNPSPSLSPLVEISLQTWDLTVQGTPHPLQT